jgi:DNA polymerase-1
MIQFSVQEGVGHAIPWDLLTLKEWDMFLDNKEFIFQNGSFDIKVLAAKDIYVKLHEDTMLMHSLVEETPGTHSLEHMARKYLGVEKWSDTVNYDDMASNDIKTLGEYGARDTDLTLRLANIFRPMVENRPIHTVLTKAQSAIIRAELRGIKVNRDLAHEFMLELAGHLEDKAQMLRDSYGLENANSPIQVMKLLYEDMGLPPQKKQGKLTTDEKAMEYLASKYNAPVTLDILEYRHLTKAKGTYVENILAASERDGRYHPDFKLAATETGRLAEPLILLIPRPGDSESLDLGQKYQARLRELFIPDVGHVMIGADYSGLEVSMAAHLTKDPQLIDDVLHQLDTHSAVAIQVFGVDIPLEPYETLKKRVSEKFKTERDLAKQATFTWLYGGSEGAITRQLGIEPKVAKAILATLRTRYP